MSEELFVNAAVDTAVQLVVLAVVSWGVSKWKVKKSAPVKGSPVGDRRAAVDSTFLARLFRRRRDQERPR